MLRRDVITYGENTIAIAIEESQELLAMIHRYRPRLARRELHDHRKELLGLDGAAVVRVKVFVACLHRLPKLDALQKFLE